MQLTLDLPQQLEDELSEEAARLGLSLPEYVLRLLSTERPRRESGVAMPRTGAELVHYWQSEGMIGTRVTSVDSPELARMIRSEAERRTGE